MIGEGMKKLFLKFPCQTFLCLFFIAFTEVCASAFAEPTADKPVDGLPDNARRVVFRFC
jgi:hypothetical protein